MTEWIECTLSDLVSFQRGYDLPKSHMQKGQYPVVGSNGIIGFHNEYTTDEPSITIGRSGNVGKPFIYYGKTWSHNTTLYVKDYKGNDPVFVFYFLKTMDLANYGGGSAVPTLNRNHIHTLSICVPKNIEQQKKIGVILATIDHKILINNAINDNLEQQVLALFYKYIISKVDFIKNGIIGDYCDIKSGYAFKSNLWTSSGIRVIKIKNIESSGLNIKQCSFVENDKINIARDFLVTAGDIIIAMTGATIGKFTIIPYSSEVFLVNQRVGKFFLGSDPINRLPFLYCTLKQKDIITEIINRGQGSAQPNISPSDILMTSCYYPSLAVIEKFNKYCKPYFDSMIINDAKKRKLETIRDTLLPKLMSGEIDVSNIEI